MPNDCLGCKLLIKPYENMFDFNSLCESCRKQENKLKERPFFVKRWYYRYIVEFGVNDMEWFEALFVNIFACILLYSLVYQAIQMFLELYKFFIDVYKSLANCFTSVKFICK